jgi:hypothetical protein
MACACNTYTFRNNFQPTKTQWFVPPNNLLSYKQNRKKFVDNSLDFAKHFEIYCHFILWKICDTDVFILIPQTRKGLGYVKQLG